MIPRRLLGKLIGGAIAMILFLTMSGAAKISVLPKCDAKNVRGALTRNYQQPIDAGSGMLTKIDSSTLTSFRETSYKRKPGIRECQAQAQTTILFGTPHATTQWASIRYKIEWQADTKKRFQISIIK